MLIEYFILLLIGIVTTMVGALPFGLVNLTVLNVSLEQGIRAALRIAHGASIIEVLFGLAAILAGSFLAEYMVGSSLVGFSIVAVLMAGGFYFLFKKPRLGSTRDTGYSGFFLGVFLNLVSLQVFLYWILAIAFLSSRQWLQYDAISVLVFISGIWTGKMIILLLYMHLSKSLLAGSRVISQNTNRIIGAVLFVVALIQVVKM